MMNGAQKSDSPIVAVKPANNPEHQHAGSGAESVEPRGGAKGNASQPRTCRTQRRESVFQRLQRMRQAARQRKKESILHPWPNARFDPTHPRQEPGA